MAPVASLYDANESDSGRVGALAKAAFFSTMVRRSARAASTVMVKRPTPSYPAQRSVTSPAAFTSAKVGYIRTSYFLATVIPSPFSQSFLNRTTFGR